MALLLDVRQIDFVVRNAPATKVADARDAVAGSASTGAGIETAAERVPRCERERTGVRDLCRVDKDQHAPVGSFAANDFGLCRHAWQRLRVVPGPAQSP